MLKAIKLLMLVSVLTMLLINHTACNQEKEKPEAKIEEVATKSPSEAPAEEGNTLFKPDVCIIESVMQSPKGKAPNFTWIENGKSVKFSDYTKGKVVFLNFWGTWCPPCRKEIPDIVQISKDLAGKDFVVIGIPLERFAEQAETLVKNFAEKNKLPYKNIIDMKRQLEEAFGGISAVPTTYIIDKKGNIAESIVGMRDKATFMTYINKVLK